ncbi:MAG: tetratricopeptide repeat protein [Candidatus Manganitrophus sp.]|nr:tetratricopeptide repeat protein [Candidatus Manganitrophus sp.]
MRELGWAFNMIGQEEEAVSFLRKALEVNPQNIQARIDLGAVFMGQMQFKEAIAEWEWVRQYDPNNKLIHKFLSQARLYEKKMKQEKKGER